MFGIARGRVEQELDQLKNNDIGLAKAQYKKVCELLGNTEGDTQRNLDLLGNSLDRAQKRVASLIELSEKIETEIEKILKEF